MRSPDECTGILTSARPTELPVADCWYAIAACDDNIVQLREAWLDPYLTGDMWLVRGQTRDLLVDCGTGMYAGHFGRISRNRMIDLIGAEIG